MKYIKLSPTEEKDFRLLFIQSLLSGFGSSFFFVVVSTYFIKKTSVPSLPPAYIMSGIFGYVLITLYKRWQKKSGVVYSYTIGFLIYGLSALALYICRRVFADASPVALYIAYIGFIVVLPFASMQALGFSTICLRVFNISQSKRLLALIGTGEVLASVIAYLVIPFLTKLMGGSYPLLMLSFLFNMAAILPLRQTYKHNKEKLDSIKFGSAKNKLNFAFFKKDRFYMLIAIVTIFSVMAVYFADYTYLLSVRYIASEGGYEIATVVAIVFSIIKTGELLISLLSGTIIRTYGMKTSLMMLPVLLVLSSLLGFSTGLIFLNIPFFLVIFLLFNKWSERVIRKGVTVPSMKVVYQVTDAEDRAQLQTVIDGTLSQYATIVAGVFLWVLSISFSSNNILFFLRIIAFVYLIAFTLWGWVTLLLFSDYKVKIKEYLHQFRANDRKVDIVEFEQSSDEEGLEQPTIIKHHHLVEDARRRKLVLDLHTVTELIANYNPNVRIAVGEPSILRKARSAYYNNENFFSRLLIIAYIEFQDEETRISFVKEYYSISELELRVQMVAMLNKTHFRTRPEDTFFFTGLCQDVATEIMWTESSLNDVADQVNQDLVDALKYHVVTLQDLLFELLKVLYEQESIQVVQDILNSKDKSLENRLFAVELLDNILETQMKKLVMPLIEDSSYSSKKERLNKTILIYELSCTDRLKEILMSNYMTVGPHIKQLALKEYYRLTNDKTMLSAYASSYVENLHAMAATLLHNTDENLHYAKIGVVHSMNLSQELNPNILPYFIKWGLFSKDRRRHNIVANEYLNKQTYQFNPDYIMTIHHDSMAISADMLGLSLILKID